MLFTYVVEAVKNKVEEGGGGEGEGEGWGVL